MEQFIHQHYIEWSNTDLQSIETQPSSCTEILTEIRINFIYYYAFGIQGEGERLD